MINVICSRALNELGWEGTRDKRQGITWVRILDDSRDSITNTKLSYFAIFFIDVIAYIFVIDSRLCGWNDDVWLVYSMGLGWDKKANITNREKPS